MNKRLTFYIITICLIIVPLLVTLLFPWVKIIPNITSDIQPYSFIAVFWAAYILLLLIFITFYTSKKTIQGKILFLMSMKKVEILFLILGFLSFFVGIVVFLFSYDLSFDVLRGLYQYMYASLFFIFLFLLSFFHLNKMVLKTFHYIMFMSFFIWIIVGFYQLFFDKYFMVSLLNRAVVTEDRGVISLSCEPAYFAHVLLFFAMYFFLIKKKFFAFFAIFMIFFLARSAVLMAVVIVICALYILLKMRIITKLLIISFVFLLVIGIKDILNSIPSDTRAVYLMQKLIQNPELILYDGSFNIRLTHFYYSYYGFINDKGMPHGVLIWPEYIDKHIGELEFLFDSGTQQTKRINSGIGGVLFEAGIGGLTLIVLTMVLLWYLGCTRTEKFLYIVIYLILFHTGYTYKTPYFYILLFILYIKKVYRCFFSSKLCIKNKKNKFYQGDESVKLF